MNNDREAFMRAIIAKPKDDLPRLIFADWLDWRGEPERAEFIRVQCKLAELFGDGKRCYACGWTISNDGHGCKPEGDCSFRPSEHSSEHGPWLRRMRELEALRNRGRELLGAPTYSRNTKPCNRVLWEHDTYEPFDNLGWVHCEWHRGFIESIICSWEDWGGAPCPRCDVAPGVRRYPTVDGNWIEDHCNYCGGLGAFGGHAAAILASTPLRRVNLTSRWPDHTSTTKPHLRPEWDHIEFQLLPTRQEAFDLAGFDEAYQRSLQKYLATLGGTQEIINYPRTTTDDPHLRQIAPKSIRDDYLDSGPPLPAGSILGHSLT